MKYFIFTYKEESITCLSFDSLNIHNIFSRIDFRMKVINFESIAVKVQIFDTAGQERFHTITQGIHHC